MLRVLPALAITALLTTPMVATAKDLDASVKFKVKKHDQRRKDKVVLTIKIPEGSWNGVKRARGKVRVNLYAGKSADETKKVKGFKGKMRRRSQTWAFAKKKFCAKGHKHLRVKIKVKSKGEKFDSVTKRFEIDC